MQILREPKGVSAEKLRSAAARTLVEDARLAMNEACCFPRGDEALNIETFLNNVMSQVEKGVRWATKGKYSLVFEPLQGRPDKRVLYLLNHETSRRAPCLMFEKRAVPLAVDVSTVGTIAPGRGLCAQTPVAHFCFVNRADRRLAALPDCRKPGAYEIAGFNTPSIARANGVLSGVTTVEEQVKHVLAHLVRVVNAHAPTLSSSIVAGTPAP